MHNSVLHVRIPQKKVNVSNHCISSYMVITQPRMHLYATKVYLSFLSVALPNKLLTLLESISNVANQQLSKMQYCFFFSFPHASIITSEAIMMTRRQDALWCAYCI